MMDEKLIKDLEKLETKYEDKGIYIELFTTDEALEFLQADINSYNKFIDEEVETLQKVVDEDETLDKIYAKGYLNGLKQSKTAVKMIFGGRVEEGY